VLPELRANSHLWESKDDDDDDDDDNYCKR
jgi:hypothetical protein